MPCRPMFSSWPAHCPSRKVVIFAAFLARVSSNSLHWSCDDNVGTCDVGDEASLIQLQQSSPKERSPHFDEHETATNFKVTLPESVPNAPSEHHISGKAIDVVRNSPKAYLAQKEDMKDHDHEEDGKKVFAKSDQQGSIANASVAKNVNKHPASAQRPRNGHLLWDVLALATEVLTSGSDVNGSSQAAPLQKPRSLANVAASTVSMSAWNGMRTTAALTLVTALAFIALIVLLMCCTLVFVDRPKPPRIVLQGQQVKQEKSPPPAPEPAYLPPAPEPSIRFQSALRPVGTVEPLQTGSIVRSSSQPLLESTVASGYFDPLGGVYRIRAD